MHAICLCLVTLLTAVPAPESSRQKLDTLKKRLPDVLNDWVKENNGFWITGVYAAGKVSCKPEVRVLRRIGPDRAKAVILFAVYTNEERNRFHDIVLTVYLTYQDGCWTTEKFEAYSRRVDSKQLNPTLAFLMMAIDEAAEKP